MGRRTWRRKTNWGLSKMSQIDKKNQEFVKTNSHEMNSAQDNQFGYWKKIITVS